MHITRRLISRSLKASIFTGTAIVGAGMLMHFSMLPDMNIAASFANVTASLSDKLGPGPANTKQTTTPQSAADPIALTTVDKQALLINKPSASESADPSASKTEPEADVLFKKFKEWAATQPNVASVQPVQIATIAQSVPARLAEETPSVTRPSLPKQRKVRPIVVHSERPALPMQNLRKQPRPAQNVNAQLAPAQTAPVQR